MENREPYNRGHTVDGNGDFISDAIFTVSYWSSKFSAVPHDFFGKITVQHMAFGHSCHESIVWSWKPLFSHFSI